MVRHLLAAASAAAFSVALSAPAQGAIYTTEAAFNAANPGATTVGFGAFAGGIEHVGTTYTQDGVDFTGSNLALVDTSFWGSQNSLLDDVFGGFIGAQFAATGAVGFYFASGYGDGNLIELSFLNGATTLFSTQTTGGGVETAFSFFGIDGIGSITGFRLDSSVDGSGFSSLGTISFVGGAGAVPEPSAWALLILGFGAVGAGMRRRKPAVSYA